MPDLADAQRRPRCFLPATRAAPDASEPFRAIPSDGTPRLADLGVWNIVREPRLPGAAASPAQGVRQAEGPPPAQAGALLARSLGAFKTPGLRDLSHSAPYLHAGAFDTLEEVVAFYRDAPSSRARPAAQRRPELSGHRAHRADVAPLAAFLRSLNEDYE